MTTVVTLLKCVCRNIVHASIDGVDSVGSTSLVSLILPALSVFLQVYCDFIHMYVQNHIIMKVVFFLPMLVFPLQLFSIIDVITL